MNPPSDLNVFSEEIRIKTLETLRSFGSGHIGGAMSIVETLAVLYGGVMRYDAGNPRWDRRDRLVMSKGHAGPALYATLALCGFFPDEMLSELNMPGGRLPSHCDMNATPGVDMTTGSLGQGMSTAIGLALGCRMNGWDNNVFLILGDGECDEGQIWEGALFASHNKLGKLVALIDRNNMQLDGYVRDVLDTGDLAQKFAAFGWSVREVDGHDTGDIDAAIRGCAAGGDAPSAIVLHTIKGRGCDFAEGNPRNHNMSFTDAQLDGAISAARERIRAAGAR
jgi:transketolase